MIENGQDKDQSKELAVDDSLYEKQKYKCARCGELKVRKKIGSNYIPKYCPDCLKIVRKKALRKANRVKSDKKWKEVGINFTLPDGSKIKLKNENEKYFLDKLCKLYINDFKCDKSSDLTLLSCLLALEVQSKRIQEQLYIKATEANIRNLSTITREIRNIQQALGITREQRQSQGMSSPLDENLDKFEVMCPKCKHIFHIYQEAKENKDEG